MRPVHIDPREPSLYLCAMAGSTQKPKIVELTGPEAASFIGVSYQQFMNYVGQADDPVPRQENKKFRSDVLGQWLRRKVEREILVFAGTDPDFIDGRHEKARKDKEAADKLALENRVRRGELVEAADVENQWTNILMRVRSRLLSMPTSLAPLVSPEDDPAVIEDIISGSVREALDELSSEDV